ncbi:MAG: S8 family serine peptidase [Actinomycetota bacterium]|nr:S8 family serine peptidase [Actinomycetota bacterium]
MHLDDAWTLATGKGAIIAIVDTGVDLDHPDLVRKLIIRDDADLIDPDGCLENGCVNNGPDDPHGHGTAMAGIAAASTNNGVGIAGAAPAARLLPVRVRYANDASLELIPDGIIYAADHGADVINVSLAIEALPKAVEDQLPVDPFDRYLRELNRAVDHAWEKGAIVIASAGNGFPNTGTAGGPPFGGGKPVCGGPGFNPKVICVGAIDNTNTHAFYSDYDALRETNYIVGPSGRDVSNSPLPSEFSPCAERIAATWPTGTDRACPGDLPPGYGFVSGTSSPTALTSGVAALLVQQGLTNDQILQRILSSAEDLGLPGWDPVYGYGKLDAFAAVN